jgi:pheromone a factor receptor
VPYTLWLVVVLCRSINDTYSWSRVHDPAIFHAILKVPSFGTVSVDKWVQVATGYVLFFVFGTGSDAYNTYKKMLLAVGLGRIFPGLYVMRESGAITPNSFINARTWTKSLSSKAKSMFWSRSDSVTDTFGGGSTRCNSVALGSMQRLGSVTAEDPMLHRAATQHLELGLFNRVFGRKEDQRSVLPFFVERRSRSVAEMTEADTHKQDVSPGASAAAWASNRSRTGEAGEREGVRVFHEVRLEHEQLDGGAKEKKSEEYWA